MSDRKSSREYDLSQQAMAVQDMIKQMKSATQSPYGGVSGYNPTRGRGRGRARGTGPNVNRQPQKSRGQSNSPQYQQRPKYSPQQRPYFHSQHKPYNQHRYNQRYWDEQDDYDDHFEEFDAYRSHSKHSHREYPAFRGRRSYSMEYPPREDPTLEQEVAYEEEKGICTESVVSSLLEYPGFSASLLQLMEQNHLSPAAVRHITSSLPQVFCLSGEKLTLKPKSNVCSQYLSEEGCLSRSECKDFHICPKYVTGDCGETDCCLGHSWNTNHNTRILKYLSLDKVPLSELQKLFQSQRLDTKLKKDIDVCLPYNSDGCKEAECAKLHICLTFIIGKTKCQNKNCQLNHDILDQKCSNLLEAHGYSTNEAPRDIAIALLEANPSLAEKIKSLEDKVSSKNLDDKISSENSTIKSSEAEHKNISGDKDLNETKAKNQESSSTSEDSESESDLNKEKELLSSCDSSSSSEEDSQEEVAFQVKKRSTKKKKEFGNESNDTNDKLTVDSGDMPGKRLQRRTLWSHYLQGDVTIPEICFYSVENMCQDEANVCPRLHAVEHFHWQVSEEGNRWLNLRSAQVTALEQSFCDVAQDEVDLPRLDPATVDMSVSGLLILMGRDTWHADFKSMTLTDSSDTKKLLLRRLCTEVIQGQTIKASTFSWYFLDKNQKWVKYGHVDSAGETKLVSSITSNDIESSYLQNPSASISFINSKFKYILDFKSMMQTNQKTRVGREVRRRPEPHLQEDRSSSSAGEQKESEFPSHWDSMQPEERMLRVQLSPSSQEYQTVIQLLSGKLSTSIVQKIERIQNPFLWRALQNKIKEMTTVYGDAAKVDVRRVFHGTAPNVVSSICVENFDWRLHGTSSGQMYGRGTYFSTDAKYSYNYCSADASALKYMFVASVALGSVTAGNSSMARPPINSLTNAPFDTTVDNVSNINILVKYDKQEYYPEYVLTLA